MAQDPRPYNEIAVRTTGVAPSTVVQSIRDVMTQLDPDLPVRQLQPADTTIDRANYQTAILRDMLSAFAVLGLGPGLVRHLRRHRPHDGAAQPASLPFASRWARASGTSPASSCVSGVKMALIGSVLGLFGALAVARFLAAANPSMHLNSPFVLDRHHAPAHRCRAGRLLASRPPRRAHQSDRSAPRRVNMKLKRLLKWTTRGPAGRVPRTHRVGLDRLLEVDQ